MTVLTDAMVLERELCLCELGFSTEQAATLARARDTRGFLIEIHAIRATIERGCDPETAYAIYA